MRSAGAAVNGPQHPSVFKGYTCGTAVSCGSPVRSTFSLAAKTVTRFSQLRNICFGTELRLSRVTLVAAGKPRPSTIPSSLRRASVPQTQDENPSTPESKFPASMGARYKPEPAKAPSRCGSENKAFASDAFIQFWQASRAHYSQSAL